MIDTHLHVLPGVDDGPESLDEAVAMLRAAAADGITEVIATPHARSDGWPTPDLATLERLRSQLRTACGDLLTIHLGSEVSADSELLDEIEADQATAVIPLAGSRHLLLEFGAGSTATAIRGIVFELIVAGWRPVIAHAERAHCLVDNPSELRHIVDLGARVQVTAGSLTGRFGPACMGAAVSLVMNGLVHVVASDGHSLIRRPPLLSHAYDFVRVEWGEALADRLFISNPRAILDDRPLPETVP